ncbi:GNAT family N-acetyltransferase [Paenibacillus lautus]|uniref:GNAT family N-acetyltransferase n=1 Tax=Paenibacillus lautus TaxID=1401 RepID=UPI002DB93790|nr:GNAT family N-acetyltransferase [Paenibacillus lautus]MEC0204904.1 GNAT family N-acetyltransferase [Paenibacillus lautus]
MEYRLVKADRKMFSKYFATYYKNNWFRPSWGDLTKVLSASDDGYWVISGEDKAAGVYLSDHSIGLVCGIPPYSITTKMIDDVKSYALKSWNMTEGLHAYNVLAEQEIAFRETGFVRVESRQCMMRPTEELDASMDLNYMHRIPTIEDMSMIVGVFKEAYADGPDEREAQVYAEDAARYFDVVPSKLLGASSVVYDRTTGEIVGVCLISLWEGLPLVYSIAVLPQNRGMGLASAMLDRALTVLEPDYPVLRLFVTTGNQAEQLYRKKGFLSGGEYHHLKYTIE